MIKNKDSKINWLPKNILDLPDDIRSVVSMIDAMFDEIYLVGGAVRDVISGHSTFDLDFSTPEPVDAVESVLTKNSLLKIHLEGKKYGTISAALGNYDIQITSYRKEEYKHGSRHPAVSISSDIDSDLSRRDFSINAMALSRDEFVDPYDGYGDIMKKIIRVIGDADLKLCEDPLRIMRAFRFVSTHGYQIEVNTLEAIKRNKDEILNISSERVGEELKKILNGKYWADALNEMADMGVLNSVLKIFDFTYKVSGDDVRHEFEKYSITDLEVMDILHRWCYLINVLGYAEKAAGITSNDLQATADIIMNKAQLHKQFKNEIISIIRSEPINSGETDILNQIENIRREARILKKNDDPRAMIEEAKYHTLNGRAALHDNRYSFAKKEFKTALDITENNFVFILQFKDDEKKQSSLRGITPYYLTRLKYYISAVILDEKLYSKYDTTDKLFSYIQKNINARYVGKDNFAESIDLAIAYIYRNNTHNITLEPYDEFLNKQNISLSLEQRDRYLSGYIEKAIRSGSADVREKSRLYLKKAKLAVSGKKKLEYGLEYYDPYVDYLYYKMLSQSSLEKFFKVYDEFTEVIESYILLTKKERKLWAGERKRNLTSASSLVYALSLARTIDQKVDISNQIVSDYNSAGRGFEKNKLRYLVYSDWFVFVKKLLGTEFSDISLNMLYQLVKTCNSNNYVDIDENYLLLNKPDIVQKRSQIKDSVVLLTILRNSVFGFEDTISDKIIISIATLLKEGIISTNDAFTLFKNYISRSENERIETEKIEITDRELRLREINEIEEYLTGESETIEYKSSWSFDIGYYRASNGKRKTNNSELTKEVLKNIAGFMNKRGGVILIGVEDDMNVCGLEESDFLMEITITDPRKKIDQLQKKMRNEIKNHLGLDILAKLSIETATFNKKTILKVKVPSSVVPVIYRDGEIETYYVRSGTTTDNAGMKAAIDKSNEANNTNSIADSNFVK